jgi:hypothetical protein
VTTTKSSSITFGLRNTGRSQSNPTPANRQLRTFTKGRFLTRTRTGDFQPKWKQIIASGGNATTLLTATTWTTFDTDRSKAFLQFWEPDGLGGKHTYVEEAWGEVSAWNHPIPTFQAFSSRAAARALAKVYSEIRKLEVVVSGPTFLGTLGQTMRMLRRPAEGLWNAIDRHCEELKRLNADNRRRYFSKKPRTYRQNLRRLASDLWLEKQFGWNPFMMDIQDALEAYSSMFDFDRSVHFSCGGADAHLQDTQPRSGDYFAGGGSRLVYSGNLRIVDVHKVRYRGVVYAQAATTAADMRARWGFIPSEFVPTAWEILPWSFLADYFANIGDILSAAVTDTSKVRWLNRTEITASESSQTIGPDFKTMVANVGGSSRVDLLHASSGWSKITVKNVQRSPTAALTWPQLRFTYPQSPWRKANIAALIGGINDSVYPQSPRHRLYRIGRGS